MPSRNPKIQGYVGKDVFARFEQWKQENECQSTSVALDQILWQFFGLDREQAKQEKEAIQGFLPQLKDELKREILEEINQRLESIKSWLGKLDDDYGKLLQYITVHPLQDRAGALEAKWAEKESLKESPSDIPFTDKESINTEGLTEQGLAIEKDDEKIDDELEKLLEGIPELSIEHYCAARLIQILEAQFGILSKDGLSELSEQDLMNIIFAQNAGINIEQAEAVYQRVLAEIPKQPPPLKILGYGEAIELNLEGDSLEESPKESPLEELSHGELVQRLKTNKNTLRSKRNQDGFAGWAQQRDNRGLIWRWDGERRIYQGFKPTPV